MGDSRYDDRYAEWWADISRQARRLVGNQCCYPKCCRRAQAVHHAAYLERNTIGQLVPIRGREIPGVHVFPLCAFHHSKRPGCAHHPSNWQASKLPPPGLDAVQLPHFYQRLLEGWREKRDRTKSGQSFQSQAKPSNLRLSTKLDAPKRKRTHRLLQQEAERYGY